MPANGLGPQAEGAARFASAAGVDRDVGVLQIADEVVLDLQVALIDRRHPRQAVHVVQDRPVRVVDDRALGVAVGETVDRGPGLVLGHVQTREIELVAGDEVDHRRLLHRALRVDGDLGPDQADLQRRVLGFQRLGALHVGGEGGDRGVHHHQVEVVRLRQHLGEGGAVRRGVDQLAVLDQGRGLSEPGGVPEALDLAPRLVARAGAPVEAVERGSLKEKGSKHGSVQVPISWSRAPPRPTRNRRPCQPTVFTRKLPRKMTKDSTSRRGMRA